MYKHAFSQQKQTLAFGGCAKCPTYNVKMKMIKGVQGILICC